MRIKSFPYTMNDAISDRDRDMLSLPISVGEIKKALFQMKPLKARDLMVYSVPFLKNSGRKRVIRCTFSLEIALIVELSPKPIIK